MPDRLVASIQTTCGDFTFPLSLSRNDADYSTWTGEGTFECQRGPGSDCETIDVDITIECAHQSGEIGVTCQSDVCGPLGAVDQSCPPMYVVIDVNGCCVDEPSYLYITEASG
ncbi:hypothetical protein [Maioricimonas rarisocia]|uniref:hypothetical protein n=1 Tax=Maioricimonas rarisocia TaxID=2528026 RepID=UPI00119F2EB7|nr:hypothetical protein [Maioricimonas rarisocia]